MKIAPIYELTKQVIWVHSPLEATWVKSYLHGYSTACIEMTAFNSDPCSSRQRPSGRMDTGKVRRLRRHICAEDRQISNGYWPSPELSNTVLKHCKGFALDYNTHTYHKDEGLGGDCFVVLVNAVPYTHFYLSLLHPVTCGIVQPTHNPEKGKEVER